MSTIVSGAEAVALLGGKRMAKARVHTAGTMNKTESRYAQYLDLRQRNGDLLWHAFEPFSLKFGPDARYTPDFVYVEAEDMGLTCVDVKPRTKVGVPWIEEASLVRMKACAEKFWWMRFTIAWPMGVDMMAWNFREVGA